MIITSLSVRTSLPMPLLPIHSLFIFIVQPDSLYSTIIVIVMYTYSTIKPMYRSKNTTLEQSCWKTKHTLHKIVTEGDILVGEIDT